MWDPGLAGLQDVGSGFSRIVQRDIVMKRALALASVLLVAATAAFAADPPLVQAIKSGDATKVRTLLQTHIDANATSTDGTTALLWAVDKDSVAIVDQLLAAGAKVDQPNRYGATPLALACTNGNAAIVQRLLKGGAN